jgi:hypothetical protein
MSRDGGGGLESFYPNLTDNARDPNGIAGSFHEFVLANEAELVEIGRTRFTQTNECRRCVALLPAIWATSLDRFHLLDFGTSAGLNLHIDRYRYRWNEVTWGSDSAVELSTEMRGEQAVPRDFEILTRTGLDLNPIDPIDSEDRRWLEALVWPEHTDRLERLQAALDIATRHPIDLVAGDALATLGPAIERLPDGDPAIVINSFILNQFAPDDRGRLDEILDAGRKSRRVFRVSMEWFDESVQGATVAIDDGSGLEQIGLAQPHGEWLELYARP